MATVTTIHDEAKEILRASALPALRDLDVEIVERRIILGGAVRSFYHKQLAQEHLRQFAIDCGYRIVNRIDVVDVLTN
jgi:hypothetical protein